MRFPVPRSLNAFVSSLCVNEKITIDLMNFYHTQLVYLVYFKVIFQNVYNYPSKVKMGLIMSSDPII